MSAITSVLNWVKDLLINILEMIVNFAESLYSIILNIPKVIEFLTGTFTALPQPILPFATATIGITIAYFIIGRQEGGNS